MLLGGSTIALASGLADNPRRDGLDVLPRIHSYDMFLVEEWTKTHYASALEGIDPGASFRPAFDRLLGTHADVVAVHEGDVRGFTWSGEPVEVLFVDICKTWEINDHVVRQFFPALKPHGSVVVQQDFIHEWLPQIHVAMGFFGDAFEYVGVAEPCSALYVPTREILLEEIPERLGDLSDAEKLACFDRACAPFTGEHRAVLECPRAVLLTQFGRHDEALGLLDAVAVDSSPRVAGSVAETRGWIRRVHPDPAISEAAWDELRSESP